MLHSISVSILGDLSSEFSWIYGVTDLLLACLTILIILSPFIIVLKLIKG